MLLNRGIRSALEAASRAKDATERHRVFDVALDQIATIYPPCEWGARSMTQIVRHAEEGCENETLPHAVVHMGTSFVESASRMP